MSALDLGKELCANLARSRDVIAKYARCRSCRHFCRVKFGFGKSAGSCRRTVIKTKRGQRPMTAFLQEFGCGNFKPRGL